MLLRTPAPSRAAAVRPRGRAAARGSSAAAAARTPHAAACSSAQLQPRLQRGAASGGRGARAAAASSWQRSSDGAGAAEGPPPAGSPATVEAVLDALAALRSGDDFRACARLTVLVSDGGATAAAAVVDNGGAADIVRMLRANACTQGSVTALAHAATLLRLLLRTHASDEWDVATVGGTAWGWDAEPYHVARIIPTLARGLHAAAAARTPAGAAAALALLQLLHDEEWEDHDDADYDEYDRSNGLETWHFAVQYGGQPDSGLEDLPSARELVGALLAVLVAHGASAAVAVHAWGVLATPPFTHGFWMISKGPPLRLARAGEPRDADGTLLWPAELALRTLRGAGTGGDALPAEAVANTCTAIAYMAEADYYPTERWRGIGAALMAAADGAVLAAAQSDAPDAGALQRAIAARDAMHTSLEAHTTGAWSFAPEQFIIDRFL